MKDFSTDCFHINHLPNWVCPSCKRGMLEIKDKLQWTETAQSLQSHIHPEFDFDWVKLTIHGLLKCNNPRCSDTVILSANGHFDHYYDHDDHSGQESGLEIYYSPIFTHPPLNIIPIPESVPEKVREMLTNSFALFFCDDNACGNRIRSTVEVMLDELKVPTENDGKFISLSQRINKADKLDSSDKKKLTALRMLGNAATHGEGKLVRVDNLNAYKLLANVFGKLFPLEDLDDLAENIINTHRK
jgi:hypothetical protein